MANKSNIRSMRFSDDILAMIESQTGDTFVRMPRGAPEPNGKMEVY